MSTEDNSNKRLAKNTIVLYFRTILTMAISLYTSRVVLDNLGVEDYGIYNAVGGVVAMFNTISGALSAAISRFITYELGKGNTARLRSIFSSSVNVQIALCILILAIAEPLGIWFLNTHMQLPAERMVAANWVFQFSLVAFCVNLISVPYNAAIIAHERMSAFAYVSIIESTLRLLVAFLITICAFDKLSTYALLLVVVAIIIRIIYGVYCNRSFEECKYSFVFEKDTLKEITGFAGWSFLTNTAYLFNTQGINILTNLFFGVSLNAARGIATQVDTAVMQFVNNFTTALNPQITKSYARNDISHMESLVFLGSKFTTYLTLFFAIPLIAETDYVLSIWLKEVPAHSAAFIQLGMIAAIIDKIGMTFSTAYSATGKIKDYVIWVSLVGSLVFPLTWICFKVGMPAESAYWAFIITYIFVNIVRLIMMKVRFGFSILKFSKEVLWKIICTIAVALIIPVIITRTMDIGAPRLLTCIVACTISTAISIYFIGLTKHERYSLTRVIRSKLKKA